MLDKDAFANHLLDTLEEKFDGAELATVIDSLPDGNVKRYMEANADFDCDDCGQPLKYNNRSSRMFCPICERR